MLGDSLGEMMAHRGANGEARPRGADLRRRSSLVGRAVLQPESMGAAGPLRIGSSHGHERRPGVDSRATTQAAGAAAAAASRGGGSHPINASGDDGEWSESSDGSFDASEPLDEAECVDETTAGIAGNRLGGLLPSVPKEHASQWDAGIFDECGVRALIEIDAIGLPVVGDTPPVTVDTVRRASELALRRGEAEVRTALQDTDV